VIVRPDKTIASVGYNGFPRGVEDSEERLLNRELKYELVVHAEMNAILKAQEPLHGYHLFVWPPVLAAPTCSRCAAHVIQSGIISVTGYLADESDETAQRWRESGLKALEMYREAGVHVKLKARENVISILDRLPSQSTDT
jgi:dCMP deaminase